MLRSPKKGRGLFGSFLFSRPAFLIISVKTISHRAGFPTRSREIYVEKMDKNILQVAKEVVIKFIEVGRISPGNFGENFTLIYDAVRQTVGQTDDEGTEEES